MFNFGKNWEKYSRKILDESKIEEAKNSLEKLLGKKSLKGKSFLDIGSGSGIFSIGASLLGAKKIIGIDLDKKCVEIAEKNAKQYLKKTIMPKFLNLSVLDKDNIKKLGKFEIVYAFGSLHHTGRMFNSITITTSLVAQNGLLTLSIYSKHFTSPFWKIIKRYYNKSSLSTKKALYHLFVPIIFLAKLTITKKNPLKKERGMDFFIDLIDWLGGYPYEYASFKEIQDFIENKGFKLKNYKKAEVPTGCNEFVFKKTHH